MCITKFCIATKGKIMDEEIKPVVTDTPAPTAPAEPVPADDTKPEEVAPAV